MHVQVQELPPSSVASLVWAYAKMGHPAAELMERVVRGVRMLTLMVW